MPRQGKYPDELRAGHATHPIHSPPATRVQIRGYQLLKKLGQDPAAASGPLLTTITDMAGFFLVLSLASLMMPLLI